MFERKQTDGAPSGQVQTRRWRPGVFAAVAVAMGGGAPLVGSMGLAGCGSEVFVDVGPAGTNGGAGGGNAGGTGPTSTTTTWLTSTSTTSTGSTSSGGPTTSSTTSTSCDLPPGDGQCNECYGSDCTFALCEADMQACWDAPDCLDLDDCIGNCGMDGICWGFCQQDYPGGIPLLEAVFNCLYCESCVEACSYADSCPWQM